MATMDNLKEAFAGESQANRKYLAFAKKAEDDGFPQVAKLFRAAAEAETVHAHAHLRALGGVKDTAENLEAAIEGEGFEFQQMYPQFLAEAETRATRPRSSPSSTRSRSKRSTTVSTPARSRRSRPARTCRPRRLCVPGLRQHRRGRSARKCPVCNVAGSRFVEVA